MERYLEFNVNDKVMEYGSMKDVIEDLKLYIEDGVEFIEIYDPFYERVIFYKDSGCLEDPLNLLED